MSNNGFSKFVKNVSTSIKKHQPEILTGIGIAGMITTTIMAVRATPKALDIMAEVKDIHANDTDKKAYAKDIITKVVPIYIPSAIVGGMSIGLVIGASAINAKRNAALATAYAISESALKTYQEKVIETVGEKKEQTIREAVAKDTIEKNPIGNKEIIIVGADEVRCIDAISGRRFKSSVQKIQNVENELNRRIISEMYISLNDLYDELGLAHTPIGDDLGWNIDWLDKDMIKLATSTAMDEDGVPCLVMDYRITPKYGYDR
jgi:hypothetical protein